MAETNSSSSTKRCAVVTGGNKGIGFEICRKLASNGILVILAARDEKRGLKAVQKLKESGVSDVVFHQLDLLDPTSITSLADFIKTQYGKLDILVNNAAINGVTVNEDILKAKIHGDPLRDFTESLVQSYDMAEECFKANYYGTKRVSEVLMPLLELSNSGRIVNVSTTIGQLEHIPNEWAKEMQSNVDVLTEERIDEVVNEFLKDFKDGQHESKGWPDDALSAYRVSKAALNSYTRIIAKRFPALYVNCVSPGFIATDMNANSGILTVEEGVESPAWLALLPDGGPTGLLFSQKDVEPF
ncbi:hypothetical protein GIB67_009623 [Kingdonia uniflora]|uniref:Short-chain dehydrogenase/reductase n=1 Tax=Kingdonia uniflora TaxID=39325 RepID=A0A7J7M2I9_9MAGN|nr:hypothetical protein GIB67_009623 [Kingdonia uniflora]